MQLEFEKWHGCRNDFIVAWVASADLDIVTGSLRRLAPKLCSRYGDGIGADGILILDTQTRKAALPNSLTIINSDGSLAQNCGNGLRCAASSVKRRSEREFATTPDGVELRVGDRSFGCQFIYGASKVSDKISFVSVEMPTPKLNEDNPWHPEFGETFAALLKNKAKAELIATVDLGNPHGLVWTNDEVSEDDIYDLGTALQKIRGGDGINVHFVQNIELTSRDASIAKNQTGLKVGGAYKVTPFERGVGLTQACGSGACSVAAIAFDQGDVSRSEAIAIDMPGGRLYVQQQDEGGPMVLAGPAEYVFTGSLEI